MSFWSNIQASRINRGTNWKNLWIPHYNRIYTKYFINDQVLTWYIKLKIYGDDKLNWTYMYYYDFFIQKTFTQTFLFLKKYNVDFSWLTQAGYIGKLNTLFEGLSGLVTNTFYTMATNSPEFVNFFFQPQAYFFFFLAWHANYNYDILDFWNLKQHNLNYDDQTTLKTLSSSLFLTKLVFSTKTNFFEKDNFDFIEHFFYTFDNYNISPLEQIYGKPDNIYADKFWLANFLLNPNILNKYPNFIFFYNNWLYKSWQLAKKRILQSIKLFQINYDHTKPIILSVDYFFARYVWFFFYMKELNVFFQDDINAGVGITHEFLAKQVAILFLKIWIWETMFSKIKEIWFYLKAYLRYFSYEGKVNLNKSKMIFKKLFSFWKLIRLSGSGIQFNTPSLLNFLKLFYFTVLEKNFLISLLNIFFFEWKFLKIWYIHTNKIFLKSLKILKILIKIWKISIFEKLSLLYYIMTFFFKILQKKKLNFTLYPKLNLIGRRSTFFKLPLTTSCLITLSLTFFKFEVKQQQKLYFLKFLTPNLFSAEIKYKMITKHWKKFIYFYDKFHDIKQNIKYSDWFVPLSIHPNIISNFLIFSLQRKLIRKKKFIYFFFILSHLTPKIFFWIFTDLSSLSHFTILLHLIIIYWQNFFFFYLFILKCLKRMYALCSKENLLFLSWPIWMFLQRSNTDITLLDLFSSSFKEFLTLGLNCLNLNTTIGDQWHTFSLVDFASKLTNFGKPNCWNTNTTTINNKNKYLYEGKFSYSEFNTLSPFFMPFLSIKFSAQSFYFKNSLIYFDKKNRLNLNFPFFTTWVPTHVFVQHYSNLNLSATLIAVFIKKKLERDHLLAEVLWSLNLLVNQADMIKGFMFLIKGRFSWKEWASKVWLKKGKLEQTELWTKLDYCKMPVILKYGSASVWVWLLINNTINDLKAMI